MKLILKNRGAGKTMDLIKESIETHAYIACMNRQECYRVHQVALASGFSMPFPLTHDDVINHRFSGRGVKAILIDDVESFIQRVIGIGSTPVKTITFTCNEEEKAEIHRVLNEEGKIIVDVFIDEPYRFKI